jgi:mono/diheme cytochrome c family protein
MDFSPAKDAQQVSTLFSDGRAMRPDVPGTVARGELGDDPNFMTGIDIDQLSRIDLPRAQRLVNAHTFGSQEPSTQSETSGDAEGGEQQAAETGPDEAKNDSGNSEPAGQSEPDSSEEKSGGKTEDQAGPGEDDAAAAPAAAPQAKQSDASGKADSGPQAEAGEPQAAVDEVNLAEPAPPSVMDTTPWLKESPLDVDLNLVRTGQKYFDIYCSVCHGLDGGGNGLVNQRAKKILAPNWIPPASLHQETLYRDKYPDGKLFNTISNGIRKMPGYAGQISPSNRWAIVAYVRALQRSRNASIDSVPADQRAQITSLKAEIDQKLAEEAEAERLKEQERAAKATGA